MRHFIASLALAITTVDVAATENGRTSFPNGADDFLVAAMPPPGFYGVAYFNRYGADRLAGDSGDLPVPFDLGVNALALRFDWVKPVTILGADRWGTLVVLPLIDAELSVAPAPGVNVTGEQRGVGDLIIGNALHWTLDRFHSMLAMDVVVPSGRYDANETVNLGRNQWVVRVNHMGTWFPSDRIDISYRLHVDANFRNPDTDYRSGPTAYLNLATGWKPAPGTTVGVSAYALRQVGDDRQNGTTVAPSGNRLAVNGIGPAAKHFFPDGTFVSASAYWESAARNGPRGRSLWVYAGTRF